MTAPPGAGEAGRRRGRALSESFSSPETRREPCEFRLRRALYPLSFAPRSRRALAMTETEDRLMATAAIIGESSRPNSG